MRGNKENNQTSVFGRIKDQGAKLFGYLFGTERQRHERNEIEESSYLEDGK